MASLKLACQRIHTEQRQAVQGLKQMRNHRIGPVSQTSKDGIRPVPTSPMQQGRRSPQVPGGKRACSEKKVNSQP